MNRNKSWKKKKWILVYKSYWEKRVSVRYSSHAHKRKMKKKEKIDGIKIKRNFQFSIKKKHNVTKTKHWFLFRNISKSHSFARFFRFHRYSFQSIETRYLLYNGEIRSSIKREHSPVKNRVTVWLKIFCESIVLCFTIKEIRTFLKI